MTGREVRENEPISLITRRSQVRILPPLFGNILRDRYLRLSRFSRFWWLLPICCCQKPMISRGGQATPGPGDFKECCRGNDYSARQTRNLVGQVLLQRAE